MPKHGALIIVLTFLVSICLGAAVIQASETFQFDRLWPVLKQPWYFAQPQGVAVDKDGNVYVADTDNHRIQKYSPDGAFITMWGSKGSGDGQFACPRAIAIDNDINIYVADTFINDTAGPAISNHRIQKFSADGTFITKWGGPGNGDGQFNYPSGIAIDSSGNVYVSDSDNHRIQKFSADGSFIKKWGEYGSDDGLFHFPWGLAVDADNNLYVADVDNDRIQKFTDNGTFIKRWGKDGGDGSPGTGDGEFHAPTGLAFDAEGYLYVADSSNNRIQKFTDNGTHLATWGTAGSADGELLLPFGIAIDKAGNTYLVEFRNERVQKFKTSGTWIAAWEGAGIADGRVEAPGGLTFNADGFLYVVDRYNNRIQKFTDSGTFVTAFGSPGTGDGQFDIPNSITVGSEGCLYVTDAYNNRVQKFSDNGTFLKAWGSLGEGDGKFSYPDGVAADTRGYIYVVDTINRRVQKFDSEGAFIRKWGSNGTGDGQFKYPQGIAVDAAGYVYVSDKNELSSCIQKFTDNGTFVTKWGSTGTDDGQFESPTGIAIDADGDLYIADTANNRIQKFTDNGTFIATWGSFGRDPGQMYYPDDVAISADGRIFVSDTENNRIQAFLPGEQLENTKAIIVAGGGPFAGNTLWDATQSCASFAYRALTYQGLSKQDICYLSPDQDLDLDGNGLADDVDGDATGLNLLLALISWSQGADNLVVYLVDHGGQNRFRLNQQNEYVQAEDLKSVLDGVAARTTVVYDACESGSFMDELAGPNRIVITSTSEGEQAQFLSKGLISFSGFFWTHIFNGFSLEESFEKARRAVQYAFESQTPLLAGDGAGLHLGSGVEKIIGEVPVIGEVSTPQMLGLESGADIEAADVIDPDADGIARVWASIWRPDYIPASAEDPLVILPTIDLEPDGSGHYRGRYEQFDADGIYQIAVYAADQRGNVSQPQQTYYVRNLAWKALLVTGVPPAGLQGALEATGRLVYNSLVSQLYSADDIYYMSTSGTAGVDAAPSLQYLEDYINQLAQAGEVQDFTVYLLGQGDNGSFPLNSAETLAAGKLDSLLDALQDETGCRVTVVYDGDRSGSFVPALIAPPGRERIVICSAGSSEAAFFSPEGDISFSSFFWAQIANGASLQEAFEQARRAIGFFSWKETISFACTRQLSVLDDDGSGIPNELSDGLLAKRCRLGIGMQFGADPPAISAVAAAEDGSGVSITAEGIVASRPIKRVWAVFEPIFYCPGSSGSQAARLAEVELAYDPQANRATGLYPSPAGAFRMSVYAMDEDNATSVPVKTKLYQSAGADIYEDDDSPEQANVIVPNHFTAQPHNFHTASDEDWGQFYGIEDREYSVELSGAQENCAAAVRLYAGDGKTLLAADNATAGGALTIAWSCPEAGIYYVQLYNRITATDKTGYDLKVNRAEAPFLGMIAGFVTNSLTHQKIDGARIRTNGGYSAISTRGEYEMMHQQGDWMLYAEAEGYKDAAPARVSVRDGEIISQDFRLTPDATTSSSTTTTSATSSSSSSSSSSSGGSTTTTTPEPPPPQTTTTTQPADGQSTTTSTVETTFSSTTTSIEEPCPLKAILGAGHPGLEKYRQFRDTRLAKTDAGQRLIRLYYAHGREITEVLQSSPALMAWARKTALNLLPLVETALMCHPAT